MENTNFQPIFDYIDEKIVSLETGLKADMATKADIQRVLDAIDAFAKNDKGREKKVDVLQNKTEQIESWVLKTAEKTEIPYDA